MRRLNYQFEHGLLDEAETASYEKKAQKLIREINSIVLPDSGHTIEIGEQMIVFSRSWCNADNAQRHAILKEMFEAVYVDTDTKQIVGVKPYAEFVPLFRQTKMVERDYAFVLENDEAAQDCDTTERPSVQYGSDGIRIIVRPRIPFQFTSPFWITPLTSSATDALLRSASKKEKFATDVARSRRSRLHHAKSPTATPSLADEFRPRL